MRQLRDHHDHSLETDQGECHRLQRLWALLQGPWKGSTHPAEEGRRADEEEEAEGEAGPQREQHPRQLSCPPPRPPVHRLLQPLLLGPLLLLLLQWTQHQLDPPVPSGSEPVQLHWVSSSLFASLLLTTMLIFGLLNTLLAVI